MTNANCANDCPVSSIAPKSSSVPASAESLDGQQTRRALLKGIGAGLIAVGLSGLGGQAQAAGSLVKAGKATAIPVKGAKAFTLKGQLIIVTQPKAGVFKAFSGICTHQGAQISALQGTNLICNVHGSAFDTTTGKVTGGPAPTALKTFAVTNKSGTLYIAI